MSFPGPDYRSSILNVTLMLKPLIRMIDDSRHDVSDDILAFREALCHAYDLADPLILRLYTEPRPQLHVVPSPCADPS